MRHLFKFLKAYRMESIIAPLFKLFEAAMDLIVPLVMAAIIDVGIENNDSSYIIKMGIVLVALGIVGLAFSITAQFFAAKAATGFATKLRHELFAHIQDLSFTQMDTMGSGTLITRMTSDINQVQSGLNLALRLLLRSPFIVFGAMIMAFTVDVRGALTFAVIIPLLVVVVFGIMLITMPMYRQVQSKLDIVTRITGENLRGARVIRAFNKESNETRLFQDANQILTAAQKRVGLISGLMNPLTYVMINAATAALIYVGAVRVDHGLLTQGEVVALINYMSQILVELIKMANLIISITRAWACGDRVYEILSAENDMKDGTFSLSEAMEDQPEEIAVRFNNVSLSYKGSGGKALEDISFEAKRGETIGIIGGTGSGKSSLVNLIPRFYDATEGSVEVLGTDVKLVTTGELREHVGVVLQKAELFKGTIADNLRWGKPDADEADMDRALQLSQAKEFVEQKGGGVNYFIEQSGRNLSGGQKQRLTIARALIKSPDILILDDSASALDFATDAKLRAALLDIQKNRENSMTVFIVSQRAASIQHADQIIVLDEGKIVGHGTHAELLKDNEVYQEIYYSQFPKEEVQNA